MENIKLLQATIDAKIAGYQLGLAHLTANNRGIISDTAIELTNHIIKDLEEIKSVGVIYEQLVNAIIKERKGDVDGNSIQDSQ